MLTSARDHETLTVHARRSRAPASLTRAAVYVDINQSKWYCCIEHNKVKVVESKLISEIFDPQKRHSCSPTVKRRLMDSAGRSIPGV